MQVSLISTNFALFSSAYLLTSFFIQLSPYNTLCSETPASDTSNARFCVFSDKYHLGYPNYSLHIALGQAHYSISYIPTFAKPRLIIIPMKKGTEYSLDGIYKDQTQLAFQYYTNCHAGRAVSQCGYWFNGIVQALANILKV